MTPCPSCGHVPTMKTTFCPECGSPIPDEAPATAETAPAPAATPADPSPGAAADGAPGPAAGVPADGAPADPSPGAAADGSPPTPDSASAPAASAASAAGTPDARGIYPEEDVENGKVFAILGYLVSFIWLVPLFQRDNAFALYHAKQALTYNLLIIVSMIPISIIGLLTFGCGYVLFLPLMYPWIMGLVYAVQGRYEPMPWIGSMGEDWFKGIVADKRPGGWPPQ